MTRVQVGRYDDLRDDELRSRARDVVYRELLEGASAVLYLPGWLQKEKSFDPLDVEVGRALVPGRLEASTEKAYLFSQLDEPDPDPDEVEGADWVPRSETRVYVPTAELDGESHPSTLDQFTADAGSGSGGREV